MADLRGIATDLGFGNVQTYIQSGNLLFTATENPEILEAALEAAIVEHFGFEVVVLIRTAAQWGAYASGSPFPDAEAAHPKWLLLGLCKHKVQPGALESLQKYATAGERVEVGRDALWIDYVPGVAKSKLTPAVLDRAVGSTVTARNWKTVKTLAEMMGSRSGR